MNKHLHRIVFNASRGLRMVVQETARSAGKATGATSAVIATSLAGLLVGMPSQAQIAGSPFAPGNQRPTVLVAPNGVPLVNIQTPSAAGVSRNIYNQLNVGPNGAILNNSRTNVQTQLGGWVQGNPFLANGPARIILNEVDSGQPTQLRGYIEVGGSRAEVIIANPAGISVDGGGFINASRATLTTGTPQLNALGGLESFLVRGGTITVDGAGLDLSKTDYAAILARALQVNAGIWATELQVVTGANQVSANSAGALNATPVAVAVAGTGPAPTFALDVAALGGMYANKITLVGTDAGLGVRNAGNLGAGAGGLVVTAAGRLENTGTMEGARVELNSAADLDNRGGTIRQTSYAPLTITAPTLSNTNGGVIGVEPVPAAGAGGGTDAGTGNTGSGGGTTAATAPPGGTGAGPATGGGSGAVATPYVSPAPGAITAAGVIRNDGGRIYAGGPITLQTPQIDNTGGALAVASMAVTGPAFSNAGGTLNVSQSFSAQVGQFDNTGGTLNAGLLDISTSGDLINVDGTLASNTDARLAVGGQIDNTRGTISAVSGLGATVAGHVNNTEGTMAAGANLALQAGSLANTGSLRGGNDATINVSGMLVNDGSITAGRHATLTAAGLQGGTAGVLGAGVQANGQLGGAGDLTVTTTGALVARGTTLAAGAATLQGSSVDLSSGTASAANLALVATQGNVITSGATVATPGTLAVTANALPGQTLINDAGELSAGQLQIQASNIANTNGGRMVQTGTGATTMATSGTLNNSGGRIASNGQDLVLQAATIANTGGKIEHAGAGTLTLSGGSFSGANGEITGNGALAVAMAGGFQQDGGSTTAQQITMDAGALSNRGGEIVQTGTQATRITVAGAADNTGGTIASNGDTTISTGSLVNQGGKIQAAGTSSLSLGATASLDNSNQGEIGAGGHTTITAGSLNNNAGRITAVGDLQAAVAGAATNIGGTLAANGHTTVTADALNNSSGTVAAVNGDLRVTTAGTTTNAAGTMQSGGATVLTNSGLNNTAGKVFGGTLAVDTRNQALNNTQGTLAATTTVNLQTGALANDAGLIQSGAAMTIDTHGQALGNTQAAGYASGQGGITSGDTLTLAAGAVNNAGGFIGAKNALTATTQAFANTAGGVVLGQSSVTINTQGAIYDNAGGQTQAVGDLAISAGAIQNTQGLIRSIETTRLNAGSVVNANTQGTNQGIEGKNVAISTGLLNNTAGAVRADANVTVTSGGTVNNTTGLISAQDTLAIVDPNAANPGAKTLNLVNTGGTLVADKSLQIDAATFSGDGTAISGQNLAIALTQDIVNNAEVAANGNLSYATTGNFTNNGKLLAGGTLTVGGSNIDNAAAGEMTGTDTSVNASGTLTNRGLIDSHGQTRINAGVLNNIGTGKIYGDHISIAAGTLNNDVDAASGQATAASIAARDTLDIGAGTINNREDALIFSAGLDADAMRIGGALDQNRQATGQGAALNNLSATIESLGGMSISMAQVNNQDVHIRKGTPSTTNELLLAVAPVNSLGGSVFYPLAEVRLDPANGLVFHRQPDGSEVLVGMGGYGVWSNYLTTVEETATDISPARLVAGGDMTINGHLYNQDSQVMAGGAISATSYQSAQMTGTRTTTGLAIVVNDQGETQPPVMLNAPLQTIALGAYKYEPNRNATVNHYAGVATVVNLGNSAGAAGAVNGGNGPGSIVEVPANVGAVVATSGNTADAAGGAGSVGGTGQTVPMVVRTAMPNAAIPSASLFNVRAGSGGYLIETDPRFAGYRQWLGSDYLFGRLGLDPNQMQKRLGDGFYEQKLIREQVAQLTGYRYLDGFSSDEAQYEALMNDGATFAQAYGLRPGIALSAAQMAQLTSDIVWLVEQTVTLADGRTERVLVPQLYVRVRPGDIDGAGALLSADATLIKSTGDVLNTGTIAGRSLVSINAENVNNLGGRIAGGSIGINARNDLNNIGGSITASDSAVLTAGRDINIGTTTQSTGGLLNNTRIDRVAGVYVTNPGGVLIASAGNDVNLIGAAMVSAGSASVGAGRNVNLGTVTEAWGAMTSGPGMSAIATGSREIGSVIEAQGNVRLAAGNDLTVRAGAVSSVDGALVATAGNDIRITAGQATHTTVSATERSSGNLLRKSSSSTFDAVVENDVLSSSLSGNTVALVAGRDINAQAAQLRSDEAMSLSAGRDITLTTANRTTLEAHASQSKSEATLLGKAKGIALEPSTPAGSRLVAGRAANSSQASMRSEAIGTTVSAGSLQTVSGRDTTLQGATVVADNDVTMLAGRNLTIESAQSTSATHSNNANAQSGMIGTWYNPALGHVKSSESVVSFGTQQVSSQVASLQGNVTLVAGDTYRQTASSVLAAGQAGPLVGGDVNILARNVVINEAHNTELTGTAGRQGSTVLGGSASVGGISTDSIRGAVSTVRAMGDTGDGRMQALGAVNLAMSGKQAYDTASALASGGQLSYGVSVNVSRNTSQSSSVQQGSEAVGSSIVGANNVNIVATGGGEGSNIRSVGSTIAAGNTVNLAADNNVTLEASKNTYTQTGTNSSNGANLGVTFGGGAQNGFSIQLGITQGRGKENADDASYNNSRVSGGQAVNITSGGDLTLRGAVVEANRVTADVGGNLSIQSLQDTSTHTSKQNNSGLNLSLCIPPICYGVVATVGASAGGARANGNFVSVSEQSGIKAGDGGFDVNVAGNTNLVGAVIESTQAAIDNDRNSFQTGGALTMVDLQNVSQSSGSSYAVSASVGLGHTTAPTAATDTAPAQGMTSSWTGPNNRPGGSAGVGSHEGSNQNSVTRSGISGIAGDDNIRTGNNSSAGALVRDWSTNSIMRDVQAQAQIAQQFNQNAAREIGTYADKQRDAARARGDEAEAARWAEGGEYRVAAHTAAGALGGGVAGAIGAGVSAALMPRVGAAIEEMGLPAPVEQALGAATAAAIGGMAGGAAGAASAYSVDINNRQLHPAEINWVKGNAKAFAAELSEKLGRSVTEAEATRWLALAGEGNTDAYRQNTVANNLGSYASEEYAAYMAAKGFIAQNALSTFVDSQGRTQTLFSATAADFINPIVYSEYNNFSQYRDFYWETLGINIKPVNPAAVELRVYEERQKEVDRRTLVDLAMFGASVATGAASVRIANGRSTVVPRAANSMATDDGIAVPFVKPPPSPAPSGFRTVSPLGSGASDGTVPAGYVTVSRWVSVDEAAQWAQTQGTAIPAGIGTPIPGASTTTVYVTTPGAPKPGGTGPVRVDFAVPFDALQTAGNAQWSQIYQPMQSTPIYNVRINLPPGIDLKGMQ